MCIHNTFKKKALKKNPSDVISICILFVGTPFRENSTSVPMAVSEPMTSEKNYICKNNKNHNLSYTDERIT